jgi:hypothetical protein
MAKVEVSERAVTQRINRALRDRNERLIYIRQHCAYGIEGADRKSLKRTKVKLDALARKLGCLAAWECVKRERK